MIVTLISSTTLHSMTLPERISGQYWLCDTEEGGRHRQVLNAEGIQDAWVLRSSEHLTLLDETGAETESVLLTAGESRVLNARYRAGGERAQILLEPATEDRQRFQKYCVNGDCALDLGRAEENQIVFSNKYVSAHHARLLYEKGAWRIADTQSRNGTFVNGRRTALAELRPGDVVYIMGLKILIGGTFFAINDPDGGVRLNTAAVFPFQPQALTGEKAATAPTPQRFHRSPRFSRSITAPELRIDAPPNREKIDEVPLALLLGPAMTMGVTAVVMGAVAVNNLASGATTLSSALPTIVMSLSMLCGTVLWPLLTKRHEKKRKNLSEVKRQRRYREYLDGVRDQLGTLIQTQSEILKENNPSAQDCAARILERRRDLWERTPDQADFLRVRLGSGQVPLAADLRFPEQRFTLEDDPLLHDLARLADEPRLLSGVPVTYSLREDPVSGILAPPDQARAMAQSLLVQMSALHSADEVKLVFLVDQEDLADWDFARWLPHVWDSAGSTRFLATTEQEVRALSAQLERELAERLEALSSRSAAALPHYVIVSASDQLAQKAPFLTQALQAPGAAGFSCITLAQTLDQLPKECTKVIELAEGQAVLWDRRDRTGSRLSFQEETAGDIDVTQAAKRLSTLEPDGESDHERLPDMVSFLELYGVGKVEHLNALTRWKENDPVNSLQAPVGVGTDGELFTLDLHEKFHGPHGLVAGMTGSGKSEFIITYILSLALNYSPEEVAFILIDYKGGGLAGAFEDPQRGIRLPHLAGTITNLDGAAVKRSLISIQSELRRRQAIFNEARRVSGQGTIDIYKYQKLYRSGQVTEAVPHLFIISDEFAELKAQQPEFMEQLVSAARIGRSLGVHLVLATQKPSGVVDDQIWSNSRFRVCLKVQERADSMDMLKRPDAAELAETGRFYLQVGFNESFALGQSAWSGAPYFPADRAEKRRDDRVAVLDHLGRVLREARPESAPRPTGMERSQVVAMVDYLTAMAQEEQLAARQLWLPAIPGDIHVDALREKYRPAEEPLTLAPVVGEYDDPFNQSQGLLRLPFTQEGNALVFGAAGSGKVLLLHTLLYDLLRQHDAAALNLYLLDLGEESLQSFAQAPQVGDVLLSGDGERIQNLFKLLAEETARRKQRFAPWGGDLRTYCRQSGETVPQILVVIHNYAAFAEQFEQLEEALLQLTRDGVKCGVYFLLTAASPAAVRYRLMQNFRQTLALQLNDRADYVGLLGSTDGVYPSAILGRGIFKTDRAYEFQTARMPLEDTGEAIRAFAAGLETPQGLRARPVPTLPERVDCALVRDRIALDAFPIGVEKASLRVRTVDLQESVVTILTAQDAYNLGDHAQGFAQTLALLPGASVTVLDGLGLLGPDPQGGYDLVSAGFEEAVGRLFDEMVRRNNTFKTARSNGEALPEYPLWIYSILGWAEIAEQLSPEGKDRLNTLVEKAEAEYNVRFLLWDTARGIVALAGTPWYKRHVSGNDGIWIGDGVSDQYALKIGKISSDLYAETPPGFGYAVRRGRPALVKLLTRHTGEEVDG